MKRLRSCVALAIGVLFVVGCAPTDEEIAEPRSDGEPDIDSVIQNVDALVGGCTFAGGVLTVTSSANQTITIGKRAVDSAILVNGDTCSSVSPVVIADSTKTKRIVVRGSAFDESLIISFAGGFFASGVASASAGGCAIDLGGGNDTLTLQTTNSADAIYIGADGLSFNPDNYKDVTYANVEAISIALGAGADALTATNATPTKGVTGSSSLPLSIFGGEGNDILVGGAAIDTIYGGPGNDTISGGLGADNLFGDEGADIFQGTARADGSDVINCGDESPNTSNDVVSYDLRKNAIAATLGNPGFAGESGELDSIHLNCEALTGGLAGDALTGNAGNNILTGGPGDDTLIGAGGADVLNGGDGNDTFDEESMANGADVINGGAGIDLVTYAARTTNLTITMDGAAADDGADGEGDNIKADVENIACGSGNDDITGNTAANRITGGAGNDRLNGGAGADTFIEDSGPNGADTIVGGLGVDFVDYSARTGDLTVNMFDDLANDGEQSEGDNIGSDVENLKAGGGNDQITGNALANKIEGGVGNDTLVGGDGDDWLDGSDRTATNVISCGLGADVALNKGAGSYATDCEIVGI